MQEQTTDPAGVRDIVIVGGGVTGTALAMIIGRYTTGVNSITLLEKNDWVAEVNSHPLNNAQTSHDGSTETNYSLDHALDVKWAAELLRSYALQKGDPDLFKITNRMAFGIGADEVATLKKRYLEFKPYYDDLELVGPNKLREIEPKLMEGRNPMQPTIALKSNKGFAINYQVLSEYMLADAERSDKDFQVHFNTEVDYTQVTRDENGIFLLPTVEKFDGAEVKRTIKAKVVVFAAGSFSLLFAQALGYGKEYTIFPVAGSFFSGGKILEGKVYAVQIEGMPFAAIHGDPDILDQNDTRFGPTTKPLPLMERHHYNTMKAYFDTGVLSWSGVKTIFTILMNSQLLWYVFKNSLYDLPVIGKLLFLKEVRKMIPTMKYRDLKLRRGAGGIRPQVVNMNKRRLEMGDSCINGDHCIFNTTPSPGASICIGNAVRDAVKIGDFFGPEYHFDRARLLADLNVEDRDIKHEVMVQTA